ncbi:MAG TPA: DHA2 family efflux MFS transporter permease subunit [Gammaproteobacteria bacterium]|nr:DHA2 family efflux MFS transporter permease subunit [Gammaproteobacteria bacterium]
MRDPAPTPNRWLVAAAVMLTTVMVILDMTIVNVTLPHMMGALGATADQITWVLTSYIVAEAITIPLTGFLSSRFGRRRVMLTSIVGFVLASALCGQSSTLAEMVIYRIAQGAFGASLIPLSQSVMVDTFPPAERGKAMALWGVGIMLGPIMGPTLGGYVTQHLSWPWVFYINVPVGLINVALVLRLVQETPLRPARADWWGAALMAIGIGSLQVVLDRGNRDGWFSSHLIALLSLTAVVTLVWFVLRSWGRRDSVVDLSLLKDRNLTAASLMMGAFGLGLFGTIALQPIMLERLLNYPAETAGFVMAPRGLGSAFSMFLVSRLINRHDPRLLVGVGLVLAATGTYMMAWYTLQISPLWVVGPSIVQGLGLGMIFVPLSTLAFDTLPKASVDAGSGVFNLMRTMGGSIGISVAGTLFTRAGQESWNSLGGHLSPFNPAVQAWLHNHGLDLASPMAPHLLARELARQAQMMAFVDAFWIISLSFLLLAPLLLLVRRTHHQPDPGPAH